MKRTHFLVLVLVLADLTLFYFFGMSHGKKEEPSFAETGRNAPTRCANNPETVILFQYSVETPSSSGHPKIVTWRRK